MQTPGESVIDSFRAEGGLTGLGGREGKVKLLSLETPFGWFYLLTVNIHLIFLHSSDCHSSGSPYLFSRTLFH